MIPDLRHRCLGCGGSCHGVSVPPADPAEVDAIVATAATLEVPEPWVDGALRQVDGACVFLADDARCRIHAALGPQAKPAACRQYPFVRTVTADNQERRGIDPGCYTWTQTFRTAERRFPTDATANIVDLPPRGLAEETSFLAAAPPSMTWVLGWLSPGLAPEQYAADWLAVLHAADLHDWVSRAGPSVRAHLGDALAALPPADAVVGWPDAAIDALWTDAIHRMVFLRLAPRYPPRLVVHMMLGGGLLWSWTHPDRPQIGAAWCRALRSPAFARRIVTSFQARARA